MIEIFKALEAFRNNPSRSGVFSDLDGTLSKIAPKPGEASVAPEIKDIIKQLSGKFAVVAIVSGRDSTDAKRILGLEHVIYVGNHGLEWVENGSQYVAPEAALFLELVPKLSTQVLAQLPDELKNSGMVVEAKKLGFSIHYRLVENRDWARELVEEAVAPILAEYPFKKVGGRAVIELRPNLDINKGSAVSSLIAKKNLENALYLGDDVTDLDVFRAFKELRTKKGLYAVSVGVRSKEISPEIANEADYTVSGVDEVRALLEWLAA